MSGTAKECSYGLMVVYMKDIGSKVNEMAMEDIIILMEMCILDIGYKIFQMAKVNTSILTEQDI